MSSTKTSRRAILAGAATLPVIAIPAPAAPIPEADVAGITARAEQAIDLLRTRYVCQNWKIDEEGAERTLQYFRGGADDDDGWGLAVDFFGQHGQSLDWIMRGDPGGMVCDAAKHSEQALSVSQSTDPIFAAIDAHRRALAEHYAAFDAAEAEDSEDADRAQTEALDAEIDALHALALTVPTTMPGVMAMLRYFVEQPDRAGYEESQPLPQTLLTALEALVR